MADGRLQCTRLGRGDLVEREIGAAKAFNPIDGQRDPITVNLADEAEESILHMVNEDPNRLPTFTLFGDPAYYFVGNCNSAPNGDAAAGCPAQDNDFAWNHGDVQPEIASTWQGWVGPGIESLGETSRIWTDHADVRPTLMTLLGLHDDYRWDGRAIAQMLDPLGGLPRTISSDRHEFDRLSAVYKQLDAPFGKFGITTLDADTSALASDAAADATYTGMDAQLQACESERSSLVARIEAALQAAETGRAPLPRNETERWIEQAQRLSHDANTLASSHPVASAPVCG